MEPSEIDIGRRTVAWSPRFTAAQALITPTHRDIVPRPPCWTAVAQMSTQLQS